MTEIVDYIALPLGDVAGSCLRQWARPEETWLMVGQSDQRQASGRLRCGIVLNVQEDVCRIIVGQGELIPVSFATQFPSPRTERVAPELDEVERFCTKHDL